MFRQQQGFCNVVVDTRHRRRIVDFHQGLPIFVIGISTAKQRVYVSPARLLLLDLGYVL